MSFREKLSWGVLLTTSAVWSFYFVRLGLKAADGQLTQDMVIWTLAGCAVVGAVFQIGLAILTMAKTSVLVEAFIRRFEMTTPEADYTSIYLDDPRTVAGVTQIGAALEAADVVDSGWADEVLNG